MSHFSSLVAWAFARSRGFHQDPRTGSRGTNFANRTQFAKSVGRLFACGVGSFLTDQASSHGIGIIRFLQCGWALACSRGFPERIRNRTAPESAEKGILQSEAHLAREVMH